MLSFPQPHLRCFLFTSPILRGGGNLTARHLSHKGYGTAQGNSNFLLLIAPSVLARKGHMKIEIDTPFLLIQATPNKYLVQDKLDRANHQCLEQSDTQDAQAFYRYIQENKGALEGVKFYPLWNLLKAAGVQPRFFWNRLRGGAMKQANLVSDLGKTQQNKSIRWHVYRGSLQITEIVNAGKRGKVCRKMTAYDLDMVHNPITLNRLNHWADGLHRSDYDDALSEVAAIAQQDPRVKIDEQLVKAITVAPVGMGKIEFDTPHFVLRAEPREFYVRDKKDANNEPCIMEPVSGGTRDAMAFYKFVAENRMLLETISFSQLTDLLLKRGIRYHGWCAMD